MIPSLPLWVFQCVSVLGLTLLVQSSSAALRTETFDRPPANWEGINNRNQHFPSRTVTQDFGYSPASNHAGRRAGEIGGRLNPAGEPAYYAHRLPKPLTFDAEFSAEGRIHVARGAGHCLLGFFNTNSINEWRMPNAFVARLNSRGDSFHCHVEYATARWRAEAGVIGEIVRGERISARNLPSDKTYTWKLAYDPKAAAGRGVLTLTLDGIEARCEVLPEHRQDGATVTHFGLMPIVKTWDSPGEVWIDDLTVNGQSFNLDTDPQWEAFNNRRTYQSNDTRPKFDFGWSDTTFAGGKARGELGGLIYRGDCREPARMGSFGDVVTNLNFNMPLEARGKVSVLRAVSDSTASIGFYHSQHSMRSNPSQKSSIPMDFLGINIEGPSSEGFFFYPVYRGHEEDGKALGSGGGTAPRIYPDRTVHDWFLRYDPEGANGQGKITVGLDNQVCEMILDPGHQAKGAMFDRFGICTPWIDGNSVTVYFDDVTYTASPE